MIDKLKITINGLKYSLRINAPDEYALLRIQNGMMKCYLGLQVTDLIEFSWYPRVNRQALKTIQVARNLWATNPMGMGILEFMDQLHLGDK